MARLIRLDRTGHTTLAEWTTEDLAAREAAVAGLPARARQRHAGQRPSRGRQRRGGEGAAARRRAGGAAPPDRRRLVERRAGAADAPPAAPPERGRARGGRCAVVARGDERADAAPRRAAVDGVDGVDRRRRSRPPGSSCCSSPPLTLPVALGVLRARVVRPLAPGAPGSTLGGPARQRAQREPAGGGRSRGGRVALGLLADLVGHAERELLARRAWPSSAASWARGWSVSGGRSWSGPEGAGWIAGAFGSPSRMGCRAATGSPTCCWRCARTSAASRRWRTRLLGCGVAGAARAAGALACGARRGARSGAWSTAALRDYKAGRSPTAGRASTKSTNFFVSRRGAPWPKRTSFGSRGRASSPSGGSRRGRGSGRASARGGRGSASAGPCWSARRR